MNHDLAEFHAPGVPSQADREAQHRHELGRDIVAASYRRGDFLLASGARTTFYFDKYLFETKPTILRRLADTLAEHITPQVDRLAGVEGGGVALAAAVSLATGLPFVIVRRTTGTVPHQPVRGELHRGERVVLIQDVVDSGSQAMSAATTLSDLGAQVTGVLAVIDREAGGARLLAAAGLHYTPLYTLNDLDI
jgi:orotate phosphoribosyltransferase